MSPAVSVLLPVRNAAATVARAVNSIRAQTLGDWELVVVDDGSSDGTAEVLAALARAEPRLRVLTRPADGIVAALNAGLAASRGRWIARMDADDESAPERLEAQVALLDHPAHGDVGLVGCLVEHAGEPGTQAGYALHVDWLNSLVTPEQIALNRFVESPFAHPSVMFRRELPERFGAYGDGPFPEDYELWLRWLANGVRMAKVPRILLRWHDPPQRLSRRDARYSPEAFFRLKAQWIARWLLTEGATPAPGTRATAPRERLLFIWGAGRPTRKRAAPLAASGVRIAGYIDVDPRKQSPALGGTGVPVISPADLPPPGKIFVLAYVSSRGARELIHAELARRGYVAGRDFLLCA
ncbi:MAG: glycosyltransferase [Verrucomicrobia bacterium]|nr:glycosyltransferase [Verrucomicrobiota bacterium]